MTGDQVADGVGRDRAADGARCARQAERAGELRIRQHLARLDADQRLPHLDLEVGAAQHQLHAAARGRAREDLPHQGVGVRVVAIERRGRPQSAQFGEHCRIVCAAKGEVAHAARGPCHQGVAEGRGRYAVADVDAVRGGLDLAGRHRLAAHHEVVQPARAAEAGGQGDVEQARGLRELLAGVFLGQVLQEALGRDARPFGEHALQMRGAEVHRGGDLVQPGLAARVGADEADRAGDGGVMARCGFVDGHAGDSGSRRGGPRG